MGKKQKAINAIKKAVNSAKKIERFATTVAKIAKEPGRSAGKAIGKRIAGPAGERVGSTVGHYLGKIVGSGDYKIKTNSIMDRGGAISIVPQFGRHRDGITVRFTEYISDIYASPTANAFQNQSYAINPGMYGVFPWLSSAFGNNFDLWEPHGIVVVYKTLSSILGGENASLGEIIMASDYDVLDNQYASKIEMLNTDFSCSAAVTSSMVHPIECARSQRPTKCLYTRNSVNPTGSDLRLYDLCNLQIATSGCLANQLCGELWMSYDITFRRKQVFSVLGKNIFNFGCDCPSPSTTHFFGTALSPFNLYNNMNGVNAASIAAAKTAIALDSSIDLVIYPDGLLINKRFVGATFLFRATGLCSTTFTMSIPGFPTAVGISPGQAICNPPALTTGTTVFTFTVILQITDPGSVQYCSISLNPWTAMGTVEDFVFYFDQVQPNYFIQL